MRVSLDSWLLAPLGGLSAVGQMALCREAPCLTAEKLIVVECSDLKHVGACSGGCVGVGAVLMVCAEIGIELLVDMTGERIDVAHLVVWSGCQSVAPNSQLMILEWCLEKVERFSHTDR